MILVAVLDVARRTARLVLIAGCVAGLALMPLAARAAGQMDEPAQKVSVRRIVSLAPNLTEMAFAAGAGELIVGTAEFSDYPEAAQRIPRVGDAFRVDLERVLALHPDVVLAWESGTPGTMVERLRDLRLPVRVFHFYRLADVARVVRELGEVAGTSSIADAAAARFEQGFEALRQEFRGRAPLSVFVQVNSRPLYTVNGTHIISEIVELCGGRNVFAALNELAPQIGVEAVLAANPQVILSADETVTDVMADWQRWKNIEAVQTGNAFTLPPSELARATPRLLAGARKVCRALETARQRRR